MRSAFFLVLLAATCATLLSSAPTLAAAAGDASAEPAADAADRLTLLVSIDGFRHDYFERNRSPNLKALYEARDGLRSRYLRPVFPSVTFPSHWTLVTGQLPVDNGMVGNKFRDTEIGREFNYRNRTHNDQPEWWHGDPVWQVAEEHGIPARILNWVGSEHARPNARAPWTSGRPTNWLTYRSRWTPIDRARVAVSWLDPTNTTGMVPQREASAATNETLAWYAEDSDWPGFPGFKRTQWPREPRMTQGKPTGLLLMYFPDVDSAGHRFGPDTKEVDDAIELVDSALGYVFEALRKLQVWERTNVVIVSDHGMTQARAVDPKTPLKDDQFRLSLTQSLGKFAEHVNIADPSPVPAMDAKDPSQTEAIIEELNNNANGKYVAYHRDRLPAELKIDPKMKFFKTRIPEIVVVPRMGIQFVYPDNESRPIGMHGYLADDEAGKNMDGIFLAKGPAFAQAVHRQRVVKSYGAVANQTPVVVPGFDSTEVYAVVCRAMGLPPREHSGKGLRWLQ